MSDQSPISVRTYQGADTATAGRAYLADAAEAAKHGYVAVSRTWQGTSLTVVYERDRDPADPEGPPSEHAAGPDGPDLTLAHEETALPAAEDQNAPAIRPMAIAVVLIAVALAVGLFFVIGGAGLDNGVTDSVERGGDTQETVKIPTATARPEPETAPELAVAGDYRCRMVADARASIDVAGLTFYSVVPHEALDEWLVYEQQPRPGFEQATMVTLYAADRTDERVRDCPVL